MIRRKKITFIKYLDANNLYGWVMSKKLTTIEFKWMDETENKNWENHPCILEVDLYNPIRHMFNYARFTSNV